MSNGIGPGRRPFAELILAQFNGVGPKEVVGDHIRHVFRERGVSTWEGAKVIGVLVSSGILEVVEELDGRGAVTWRRSYRQCGELPSERKWVLDGVPAEQDEELMAECVRLLDRLAVSGKPMFINDGTPLTWQAWRWLRMSGRIRSLAQITDEGRSFLETQAQAYRDV